jgi:hypothetical protein
MIFKNSHTAIFSPDFHLSIIMAQCPLPLASAIELATNYNVAGIIYSQKRHITHCSSERNAIFRNMVDASAWHIDLRPAEAQLQQLAAKGHKSDFSTIPTQTVESEGDVNINTTQLLLSPVLDMLRRTHPGYKFDAKPEDTTEGVIQYRSGHTEKLRSRIDVVIYATNIATNKKLPILLVEMKQPQTLIESEFKDGNYKPSAPRPIPSSLTVRLRDRMKAIPPASFQGNALKVLCQIRKYMAAFKIPMAVLLDGEHLVGLRVHESDLCKTTMSSNEKIRPDYFFKNNKSQFVLILFAVALLGLQRA